MLDVTFGHLLLDLIKWIASGGGCQGHEGPNQGPSLHCVFHRCRQVVLRPHKLGPVGA